jgi:hypothetical protein
LDNSNPDVRRETVSREAKNRLLAGCLGNAVAFFAILLIFAIRLAEIFSGRSQIEYGSRNHRLHCRRTERRSARPSNVSACAIRGFSGLPPEAKTPIRATLTSSSTFRRGPPLRSRPGRGGTGGHSRTQSRVPDHALQNVRRRPGSCRGRSDSDAMSKRSAADWLSDIVLWGERLQGRLQSVDCDAFFLSTDLQDAASKCAAGHCRGRRKAR